ncbi:DEAD/DEAH box helicase family protein [Azospirillum sp. YIM DDC1]|uniref:DEAD/DEAH box helicase family protein n=1 Tax=Azospirillum aestuarii TaxID=2802052 RepID=A0ABS1HRU6_9PROT|nr:DEAD/DEAH box helicase family protein [Azospirillum aestuarii]MBK4717541.1 DEAD/DEAH box helicase family protein [Azospirillum aestuarii]
MTLLRDLPLKAVYRSEDDNILTDLYLPALGCAVSYDRAVGYFSASMLSFAAEGVTALVRNGGRMRLIVGGELDEADADAISKGYGLREASAKLGERFLETIDGISEALCYRRLEALSWLVASGRLDIKVALKKKGMYHEKIGIITDAAGDSVIFQGSANETTAALLPDFNFESINVFPSWRTEFFEHFTPYVEGFARLWEGRSKNVVVIDFPEAAKERLIRIAAGVRPPSPEVEQGLWERLKRRGEAEAPEEGISEPRVPTVFNGREFTLMDHQRAALSAWRANEFSGILALATGAGKTVTSIYGAMKVYEKMKRMFLLIAVPYQNLADQWVATLREFNIHAIRCYGGAAEWRDALLSCVTLFQTKALPFVCAVVVNRTLQSEGFRQIVSQVPGERMMFIGDECHHHGSEGLAVCLPRQAALRLGLSATPEHYADTAATERLKRYYGDIVFEYGLEQALRDGVLTPYEYHVIPVELTDAEAEEYARISEQISRIAARGGGDLERSSDPQLDILLFKRARLLGAASNKLPALRRLLEGRKPEPLTLFYCGDGSVEDEDTGEQVRQIAAVSAAIHELGWKNSHFTSREGRAERQGVLDGFKVGFIDTMVAIRCLDEGIDVPDCRTAYILASSRNPKQFIQRRGRILRRAPGKERARIFDFVVTVPESVAEGSPHERQLLAGELKRVAEFARLALNAGDAYLALEPILERYDLVHHLA